MQTNIDWNNLSFRLTPTKTMYMARTASELWPQGEYLPYGPIGFWPAAGVLNYGQGILEGLKAYRTKSGQIVLFRPIENAKRFAISAERLSMPPVPIQHFLEVMIEIVRQNREYVPPIGLGSLYIRPCLWGTGAILGMAPAPEYSFVVYTSPVGNYFKAGAIEPVKFQVCEDFHRSAPKGIGSAKFAGNYAPTLSSTIQAKKLGYAGNIYLDAVHEQYVEEAGVANFFCVKDGKLLTPQLSKSILAGVTRASVMQLAREILGLEVLETKLSLETVLTADECFCTGTAAVVTPIGVIAYAGKEYVFQQNKTGSMTQKLYELLVNIQQGAVEDRYDWLVPVD